MADDMPTCEEVDQQYAEVLSYGWGMDDHQMEILGIPSLDNPDPCAIM